MTRGEAATDRAAWGRGAGPTGSRSRDRNLGVRRRSVSPPGWARLVLAFVRRGRPRGWADRRTVFVLGAGGPAGLHRRDSGRGRNAGVTFRPGLLASRQDVQTATELRGFQLVDARSEDEYLGKGVCPISKKPLPGGRAGHLPSAKLLEAAKVVREDGTFLDAAGLRALMSQAGIETDRPIILYSKGGARSNATVFALRRLGVSVRHYVAGLNEWASDPTLPLVTTSEPFGAN